MTVLVPAPERSESAQRVLAVALDLFARHGFDGTSLQLIADQLGVTKAAVYYHFRTKNEILSALVRPAFEDLERLIDAAGGCARAGTRRDQGLRAYVDHLLRYRRVVAFLDRDVSALAQPEVREPMQTLTARMRQLLTAGGPACADPLAALWAAATLRGLSGALLAAPDASDEWMRTELLTIGRHMTAGFRRAGRRSTDAAQDPTG